MRDDIVRYVCRGLKRPLERLLAGLLETDDRNRWSYDAFFRESLALTSRPPVYVFCLSTSSIDRLYITSPNITSVLNVWSPTPLINMMYGICCTVFKPWS